jgi:hypothetical protein
VSIESRIHAYFGKRGGAHHRYRSWEHCYQFFQQVGPSGLAKHRQDAAMQLGFYLASWGMYRGGSFLLQRAYTVHLAAIDCLSDPRWSRLWSCEFGASDDDEKKVGDIVELRNCIGAAYKPFGVPTDTLATKIMLGTLGCSPACDRYFIIGFTAEDHSFSCFNQQFVKRVLGFCGENLSALRRAQTKIERSVDARYPLMKLVDMYFFQSGWERSIR